MADLLLLVVLMYSFNEIKAQDLHPPKLTVSPLMITETDSVTLNCQNPLPVFQCYFIISGYKIDKTAPCLWTLTGSEFLSLTHESSPVTIEVTCYYLLAYKSPMSNMSAITIQPPRPELTVNPLMIIETDSVTVNCQTPSSVNVTQCFLYFMRRRNSTSISCQQTLTGTELLSMAQQSSPAEVEVTCFYMTEHKGRQYQSPHSNISSINIQTTRPELTVNPRMITETDSVALNCQAPSSFSATQCFLYFTRRRNSTPISCLQILRGTELLSLIQQSSPAEVEVTCFYMSQHKGEPYQSPHSNIYFISIQTEKNTLTSAPPTSINFTSDTVTRDTTIDFTSTKLSTKRTTSSVTTPRISSGDFSSTRKTDRGGWMSPDDTEAFNMTNLVPGDDPPKGSDHLNRKESQTETSSVYHLYSTIPEEPDETPTTKTELAYSTLQPH
ncbi:uncharacterized protein LOC120731523 isoform X4 [Simochromis diagramma]|uniref:uncharacterized protein LOC120731523 isoform X4 n=1 Tax=Simochromis diagramma TaxID=43689 RepID=UPI001A7E836C|nr:uncharacterized protein LOC120731523 isoform X4 [Simochromis diagramma]